jgi:hypothetical protein
MKVLHRKLHQIWMGDHIVALATSTDTEADQLIQQYNLCGELLNALKDIVNAAGNNQPYNKTELEKEFVPIISRAEELLGNQT